MWGKSNVLIASCYFMIEYIFLFFLVTLIISKSSKSFLGLHIFFFYYGRILLKA